MKSVWALVWFVEALHLNVWVLDGLYLLFLTGPLQWFFIFSIVYMHCESWVILSLRLYQLKVIVPQRSLRTCRCHALFNSQIASIWIENILRWTTYTAMIERIVWWFFGDLLILMLHELLLCTSSCILAIHMTKHGLDRHWITANTWVDIVWSMNRDRLKLKVLPWRLEESHIRRLRRSFHLWRWRENVFPGTLLLRW